LFEKVVLSELTQQLAKIDYEINDETGTVSITVTEMGFVPQYRYYVLKQYSN